MNDHSHIVLLFLWIKKEWLLVSTAIVGLWYSAKWSWGKMMHVDYMGRDEIMTAIKESEAAFADKLDEHEKREFKRQDEMVANNNKAHDDLRSSMENLTNTIIQNMGGKRKDRPSASED